MDDKKVMGRPAVKSIFTAKNITAKTPKIQNGRTVIVPLGTPAEVDENAEFTVYFPDQKLLKLEASSFAAMLNSGALQEGTGKDAQVVQLKADIRVETEREMRQARVDARPENLV